MAIVTIERELGGKKLTLETGRMARLAHGALTVQYGDTVVLATVLSAPPTRDINYFPLYVDYREQQYAGGKFPGGVFKREGRPTTKEGLSCRMIDRTIRPLFPDDFNDEVQIQCMVIAVDKDHDGDVLAMIGGSAALALSPAPFLGPIGAVRVGRVDGELIVFPTYAQRAESDFDLIVAGRKDSINMMELGGKQVPEDDVVAGCAFAHEQIKVIIEMIEELAAKAGKEKTFESTPLPEALVGLLKDKYGEQFSQAKQIAGKTERGDALSAIRTEVLAELCPEDVEEPEYTPELVRKGLYKLEGKVQRELILQGHRPDGRDVKEIRPITIEAPALPRVHGSSLFTRGETQSFLFGPRDTQAIGAFLADDPNARIFVISGAWAVPLFRAKRAFSDLRREAARLQKIESAHLAALRSIHSKARIRIWTMADFVEAPMEPLQSIIDTLGPRTGRRLAEAPKMHDLTGFGQFLQNLKNQGMQPHLMGDFPTGDETVPVEPPRRKPYLVS